MRTLAQAALTPQPLLSPGKKASKSTSHGVRTSCMSGLQDIARIETMKVISESLNAYLERKCLKVMNHLLQEKLVLVTI